MTQPKKKVISLQTPVQSLQCVGAFDNLTPQEKLYSYYTSKASWEGAKICFFQKTNETPAIFIILQLTFSGQSQEEIKQSFLSQKENTLEQFQKLIAYSALFFTNCGNYKSFGGDKFVPDVSEETFWSLIQCSQNFKAYKKLLERLFSEVKASIFNNTGNLSQIGYPPEAGQSGYYSNNLTKEEIDMIDEFLVIIKIDPLNTRISKRNDQNYVVKIASVDTSTSTHYYKGNKIDVCYGDFSSFLKRVVYNLQGAMESAANKNQKNMLQKYIDHFSTGDIEAHKNSQREWIKDKGPVVEINIGFVESYLDPKQVRAEWEGFTAIVDKIKSEKTQNFVNNAPKFIELLPWSKEYEKDEFLKPDFTSLEILSNGASTTFLGINIPNYDDIRQDEGFKNVYFSNVLGKSRNPQFFSQKDSEIITKYSQEVGYHQVICHELLGHGVGKLFYQKDGKFNFDQENTINPLNGEKIQTYYKDQETWMSVFQNLSNPYEECRADTVALYMSCFKQSFDCLLPEKSEEWQEINKACFVDLINQGIQGLAYYDAEKSKWGQAHINGRFVMLQVLLSAGNNFLNINIVKDEKTQKDTLSIELDHTQILTTGKQALHDFLLKLQVYKSTADYKNGSEMYNNYSRVDEKYLKIRQIVIDNQRPRKTELQGHIYIDENDKQAKLQTFDETLGGIVESYMARYPYFDVEMLDLYDQQKI